MARARKPPDPAIFEKLGAFYLGREYDVETEQITSDLLLYDAKDLTTHAVCVGMTGSGKTGLCVSLLEEAAVDGIPAIAIDPKGDLGNMLLTFPKLRQEDFRPWVDDGEASRKGMTPDEYAKATAEKWKTGLADWGQKPDRIRRLRDAADIAIYTPGGTAGLPLTVLGSFAAPPAAIRDDADAFRERVSAASAGLLALVGIEADPIQSREHILLTTLLQAAWQEGRDMDIPTLIAQVQSPPIEKVGVMEIDTFFPSKERFGLAMRLNGLIASPGFAAWMEGEPLDIQRLLWTPEGKPRIAILSIAHLSDAERMFFVTLLLNELITWMRTQSGTPSLRALLYMDEVFGYFPPTANPPSKTPMLTLLKQARAYGLGVVLATQNPVDLDYKGLSNAGTWFLGRLQTERDKLRVIEGLEGASALAGGAFDRQAVERTLAGLDSRVFLMNNVHDNAPVLFHTRWAMSYLRGPLTSSQINTLMAPRKQAPAPDASHHKHTFLEGHRARQPSVLCCRRTRTRRLPLSRPIPRTRRRDCFIVPRSWRREISTSRTRERGSMCGKRLRTSRIAQESPRGHLEGKPKDEAVDVTETPQHDADFAKVPSAATNAKRYATWSKSFKTHLYRDGAITLQKCTALKLTSTVGERPEEFRIRLREAAREMRDLKVEKLRKRYAPKLARLQERIRKAEERVGREQGQLRQQTAQTAISMGATVLGALFGRKVASVGTVGRATTAMRGVGRAAREKEDIARAQRDLDAQHQKLVDLEAEFAEETAAMEDLGNPDSLEVTEKVIRPRKTDIAVSTVRFVWLPSWIDSDGVATPAFE